ncbi:MAG: hypothetical protein ACOCYB_11725 [Alkalispirochaeta sp.]
MDGERPVAAAFHPENDVLHYVRQETALFDRSDKYQDQPMDLADATLIVAAEETGIREILSIDRDFLVYRAKASLS